MTFNAIYMPAVTHPSRDPSREGFTTREEAEAYVKSHWCADCLEDESVGESSGCGCEWVVEVATTE